MGSLEPEQPMLTDGSAAADMVDAEIQQAINEHNAIQQAKEEERRNARAVWKASNDMELREVAGFGNCLYDAVASCLPDSPCWQEVKASVLLWMESAGGWFDKPEVRDTTISRREYIDELAREGVDGDASVVTALVQGNKVCIKVFNTDGGIDTYGKTFKGRGKNT